MISAGRSLRDKERTLSETLFHIAAAAAAAAAAATISNTTTATTASAAARWTAPARSSLRLPECGRLAPTRSSMARRR